MTRSGERNPGRWLRSATHQCPVSAAPLRAVIARFGSRETLSPLERLAFSEALFRLAVSGAVSPLESEKLLARSAALDPLNPKLHYYQGLLRHRTGQIAAAVCSYRQALRLAPESRRVICHLTLALHSLGGAPSQIGRELISAAWSGKPHQPVLEKLDRWLKAEFSGEASSGDDGKSESGKENSRSAPGNSQTQQSKCGAAWRALQHIYCLDLLSRPRRPLPELRQLLEPPPAEAGSDHADLQLLGMLARLAGRSPNGPGSGSDSAAEGGFFPCLPALMAETCGSAFVQKATEALEKRQLPEEWVCALHYQKFGPDGQLSCRQALELLHLYPRRLLERPVFRELRIATLDAYARKAYGESSFSLARVLWQEAYALDPRRIAVCHNLALAAARVKAAEEFETAWARAFDLRYMAACAAGDFMLGEPERSAAHRAVAAQAAARYLPEETKGNAQPAYGQWLYDREALDAWLEEWDLFYLNRRLAFRSPVHRLGISRDAAPVVQATAVRSLLILIEVCRRRFPPGAGEAVAWMAANAVREADQLGSRNIERARDRHFVPEKPSADRLCHEAALRIRHIVGLTNSLATSGENARVDLCVAARLGISLLVLPLEAIAPLLARMFRDLDPTTVRQTFEDMAIRTVACASWRRSEEPAVRRTQAGLNHLFALMPERAEEARALKRRFAVLLLPEDCRRVETQQQAERAIEHGLPLLEKIPELDGLRWHLAEIMSRLQSPKRLAQADRLLEQGLERGMSPEFTEVVEQLRAECRRQASKADAAQALESLLKAAAEEARQALLSIQADSPETVLAAREALAAARAKVRDALEKASAQGLKDVKLAAARLEDEIDRLAAQLASGG